MRKSSKFLRGIKDPLKAVARLIYRSPVNKFIPDKPWLYFMYRAFTGRTLHLKNPRRFNEKMQWLKLHDREDWHTQIADKVEVRKYVAEKIGEQYLIPDFAVYNSVDEIEWSKLPSQYVLKTTHDSGTTVVCANKEKLDIKKAEKYLRERMAENYFNVHREYGYKNIKPRIVCEHFLSSDGLNPPIDYKFFCFHGVPRLIQVDTDRFTNHGRLIFYTDWTRAPFDINAEFSKKDLNVARPQNLDEMLAIAVKLSQDFTFIRVDLYSVKGKVYFGELTLCHGSGYESFYPDTYDFEVGDLLDLSK